MRSGERQVAASVADIRPDHVQRYALAAAFVPTGGRVLDYGCGCGYGSHLLAMTAAHVLGVDDSDESIEFARREYDGGAWFVHVSQLGAIYAKSGQDFDAVVCLETLEHLDNAEAVLNYFRGILKPGGVLVASTPIKRGRDNRWHNVEWSEAEFEGLIEDAGFEVTRQFRQRWDGQAARLFSGPHGGGQTQILIAERREA